ncbi:hypothetical protein [Kribbella qitaiheensis]|uniref:hypothetical protein n=1 Tax=Kribbella qitaiheensis TaxID=1544730 RepID=UPI001FEBDE97|nr:hypothetical protein [Kribbella qitaiheensis]
MVPALRPHLNGQNLLEEWNCTRRITSLHIGDSESVAARQVLQVDVSRPIDVPANPSGHPPTWGHTHHHRLPSRTLSRLGKAARQLPSHTAESPHLSTTAEMGTEITPTCEVGAQVTATPGSDSVFQNWTN